MEKKEQEPKCDEIKFNGYFTEEIREILKKQILKSKLTPRLIAQHFGITPNTLYKWLNGPTQRCMHSLRYKMENFLNTNKFSNLAELTPATYPDVMLLCMERISKYYDLCQKHSQTGTEFIHRLDQAALHAIKELLPHSASDSIFKKKTN